MPNFSLANELWKAEIDIPAFGNRITVYIAQEDGGPPTPRQLEALDSLQHLPSTLLPEIAAAAEEYYRVIDEVVNLASDGVVIDSDHIEQHYRFTAVLVPELRQCDVNYLFISAECDWEEEHGMEIIIEDNHVIYCDDHTTLAFSARWTEIVTASPERRIDLWHDLFNR